MSTVEQNFNQYQISLIQDGIINHEFIESQGDYIKMTVINNNGNVLYSFQSNLDLDNNKLLFDSYNNPILTDNTDPQIKIYRNTTGLFYVKPNEILEYNGVPSGDYTLKFDFLKNIFTDLYGENLFWECTGTSTTWTCSLTDTIYGSEASCTTACSPDQNYTFHLNEISPSRKEVRLFARNDVLNDVEFSSEFISAFKTAVGSTSDGSYNFDYVLTDSTGLNNPIVNYEFDSISVDGETSLVIRLQNSLPTNVSINSYFLIEKEVILTQTSDVHFISDITTVFIGTALPYDDSMVSSFTNTDTESSYQNLDDLLISSSFDNNVISNISASMSSVDVNLNIDYSSFINYNFFGSAVSKLEHFKTKVSNIEDYLTDISASLLRSGSHITTQRISSFDKIQAVKNNFTPYERFLYYDNQNYSTASAPTIGNTLAASIPVSSGYTVLSNYNGLSSVYRHSNETSLNSGSVDIFTDMYHVQNAPFFNHSGSVYLSFLMKGTEGINLAWTNNNIANTGFSLPEATLHSSSLMTPMVTGSEYRKYVFQASQSYWRPQIHQLVGGNGWDWSPAGTSTSYEILSGSNITGSYDITVPPEYNQWPGTFDADASFTGSVMPMGELFNIHYVSGEEISSSFTTDVKITLKDPSNVLPFSYHYSTGSAEWTNWYDDLHSTATTYDDSNIHSLVNNLPSHFIESSDSDTLKTFLNMWGEHFDLIKNYIDNYITLNKRQYNKIDSVPANLLPILADNLGWELINPYSGSLSDYFYNVSYNDNVQDIGHNTWRKLLNNLMYIYKTKGTDNSIRALLNIYGYPADILKVNEYNIDVTPSSTVSSTPDGEFIGNNQYIFNNDIRGIPSGIEKISGVISSIDITKHNLYLMSLSSTNQLEFDWQTNGAIGDGIELIYSTKKTNNTQTLIYSSGSNNLWDVRLVPSASSTTTAKFELRINDSSVGASAIASNAESASTSYMTNVNGGKLWNLYVTRDGSNATTSTTQKYNLYAGLQDNDKITEFTSASISTTTTNVRDNFVGTGSLSSGNLILGSIFTGSIGEVRMWSGSLKPSVLKQHIVNKLSFSGNDDSAYRNNRTWHYKLNENYISGSTSGSNVSGIRDANPTNIKDFSKTLTLSNNGLLYNRRLIDVVKVRPKHGGLNVSTNNINVDEARTMRYDLNPLKYSEESVFDDFLTDNTKGVVKKIKSNQIDFSKSPSDVIDDHIINSLSDFRITDKIGNPTDAYSKSYPELDTLRKQVMTGVSVDINTWIDSQRKVFNQSILQSTKKLLPARSIVSTGITLRPTLLERNKIVQGKMTLAHGATAGFFESNYIIATPAFSSSYLDMFTDELNISNIVNLNFTYNYIPPAEVLITAPSTLNVTGEYLLPYTSNIYMTGSNSINMMYQPNYYISNNILLDSEYLTITSSYNLPYTSNINIVDENIINISGLYKPTYDSTITLSNENITGISGSYTPTYDSTITLSNENITGISGSYTPTYDSNITLSDENITSISGSYTPTYDSNITLGDESITSISGLYKPTYDSNINLNEEYILNISSSYTPTYDSNIKLTDENNLNISVLYNLSYTSNITLSDETITNISGLYNPSYDSNIKLTDENNLKIVSFYNPTHDASTDWISTNEKTRDQYPWQDDYGNDYHIMVWQDLLNNRVSGSLGDFNVGYHERQQVFSVIGDVEMVSSSKQEVFCSDNNGYKLPNTTCYNYEIEYENSKYFLNREMRDKGLGHTYNSYINTGDGQQDGRPVGRTAYFSSSNGTIYYPSNHRSKFMTARTQLRNIYAPSKTQHIYDSIDSAGNTLESVRRVSGEFPNGLDAFPLSSSYSVEVEGSDTKNILTVNRK
jgi:hypothetical protein